MDTTKIPEGYQAVMPYLILKDAARFMDFVQKVFQANQKYKTMRDNAPDVIMHAEVELGGSTIMFAEATDQWKSCPAGMFVYVDHADETYQKALKEGAVSLGEPTDQAYGRSCGVKDPFGNTWWITSPL